MVYCVHPLMFLFLDPWTLISPSFDENRVPYFDELSSSSLGTIMGLARGM